MITKVHSPDFATYELSELGKLRNLSMTISSSIKWDYNSAFIIGLVFVKYFEHLSIICVY